MRRNFITGHAHGKEFQTAKIAVIDPPACTQTRTCQLLYMSGLYVRPPESHRFTFVGRDSFKSMLHRSESSSHSMLLTCNGPVPDPCPFFSRLLHKSSARNNYNIIISLRDVNSSASQAGVLLASCTPRTPFSVSSGCDETLLPGMYRVL